MATKADASAIIARYVVDLAYQDIPLTAVEAVKRDILDTLGVTIAGSSVAGGTELADLIRGWGGKAESTLIMQDQMAPAPQAALVNATMAHALDFDDAHEGIVLHAGVTVITAALAIAEMIGKVGGREVITAATCGIEVICRLGEASTANPSDLGFMYTSLYGIFGAAAAAGKLLGLNERQMLHAFGIAYSQAAGNFQCVVDGALSKRLQAGFAASGGVLSALMARKGLTGAINSLEGDKGLFKVYHRGHYNPKKLTAGLGETFKVQDLSFKPYPCCRNCHPFIDATLELAAEHKITPDNIEEISVACGESARMLCEPLEVRQHPRTFVDAQFSIPWVVATALVKGKVTLDDFTNEAIKNHDVLRLASLVRATVDPAMSVRGTTPARIAIKVKDSGRIYSRQEDLAKGHPRKPIGRDELIGKFRDCAAHGRKTLSPDDIEKLINRLTNLEKTEDIRAIMRLLA